jgi:hypothetical protein
MYIYLRAFLLLGFQIYSNFIGYDDTMTKAINVSPKDFRITRIEFNGGEYEDLCFVRIWTKPTAVRSDYSRFLRRKGYDAYILDEISFSGVDVHYTYKDVSKKILSAIVHKTKYKVSK